MTVTGVVDTDAKRRVICVVTDSFAPFQQEIVEALRLQFSELGYGTLCVAGRCMSADADVCDQFTVRPDQLPVNTHLDVAAAILVSGAIAPDNPRSVVRAAADDDEFPTAVGY